MVVQLQLYMWSGTRAVILERHDFYVEQVRARVFAQFRDISEEAERYAEAEYERLGSMPGDGDSDLGALADQANDRAQSFYGLLSDLRKQLLLGALAGLYHQWEKDLRDFIERELVHNIKPEEATKVAWDPNIGNVFDALKEFGWDCRLQPFFAKIEACRLVVNVYKHGKGRSLDELALKHPEYLDRGFPKEALPAFVMDNLDYEYLAISETQFNEIAVALRDFWVEFPERMYLK